MNYKQGLANTISCPTMEFTGRQATEKCVEFDLRIPEIPEQKKNTSLTPVGQATDKKLRSQPTKMNSFTSGPI